jgi:phosphoserine phosphatase RsbU/P
MLLNLAEHAPEPLRSQVARQLRDGILKGDLLEGASLPPPHHLARAHRVPALAVQQAYEALAEEGLVEHGDEGWRVVVLPAERRRELAQQWLFEEIREQELSLTELRLARDLQRRLLPPAEVAGDGFFVAARSVPARVVAGDFYDVFRPDGGDLGVVVADVAGKGIAAALLMASVKAMTPFVAAGRSVAATLTELNRRLHAELGPREFVALAYARIDPITRTVELANAGLPDPLVLAPGREPEAVEVGGPRLPLGARAGTSYRHATRVLAPGERLLLVTDGLAEAQVERGSPLGHDAVARLAGEAAARGGSGAGWLDDLFDRVQLATGPVPEDDWTAVLIELAGGAGS